MADNRAEDSTNSEELPSIELSGRLLDRIDTLSSTAMSLLATVGKVEGQGREILVPFVALSLRGYRGASGSEEPKTLFESILGLENSVFLTTDLIDELSNVFSQLKTLSGGGIAVSRDNLSVVLTMLESTREKLNACVDDVQNLLSPLDPAYPEEE